MICSYPSCFLSSSALNEQVKTVEDMQRMVGEIFQKLASESSTSQNGAEGGEAMAEDVAAQ